MIFVCALVVVAVLVTVVRAARGHRPTKEMWSACFMGGTALFAAIPEVIPHSTLPAGIGLTVVIGAWFVYVVRSKRRPE